MEDIAKSFVFSAPSVPASLPMTAAMAVACATGATSSPPTKRSGSWPNGATPLGFMAFGPSRQAKPSGLPSQLRPEWCATMVTCMPLAMTSK